MDPKSLFLNGLTNANSTSSVRKKNPLGVSSGVPNAGITTAGVGSPANFTTPNSIGSLSAPKTDYTKLNLQPSNVSATSPARQKYTASLAAQKTTPTPTPAPAPQPSAVGGQPNSFTTPSGATVDKSGALLTQPKRDPMDNYRSAFESYLSSLQPSSAETEASKYLADLSLQSRKDYEKALESGETLGFATGEAARVNRNNSFGIEAAANTLNALTSSREAMTEAQKARLGFEENALERTDKLSAAELDRGFKEKQFEEDKRRADQNYALSEKKFSEDQRQFGLEYALKERELALKKSESDAKNAPKSSESLSSYTLANELLSGGTAGITGAGQNPLNFLGLTNQSQINKYKQLKGVLALENRQQLKGSGAISDFEFRVLTDAASALGRNLSNQEFDKELRKVRGAFATAAGMAAPVSVINPQTGEVDTGSLGREDIEDAIRQGFTVEYR